jgi:hypothetical protein
VVDDFVAGCADDPRINATFAMSDVARLKTMLEDPQIVEIDTPETGAPLPNTYQPAPPLATS